MTKMLNFLFYKDAGWRIGEGGLTEGLRGFRLRVWQESLTECVTGKQDEGSGKVNELISLHRCCIGVFTGILD